MEFVVSRLMHEVSKRKEKGAQSGEAALVAAQNKARMQTGARLCFTCGKPGHIARHCFLNKKKEKESANIASNKDNEEDYAFVSAIVATNDEEHAFAINDGDNNTMAKWIIDSGATKHMTPHRAAFQTYEVISPPRNVHLGDDSIVHAVGVGTIVEEVMVMGVKHKINIKEVLHIPKFKRNLISVVKLALNGLKVEFDDDACLVRAANRKVIARLPRVGSLYEMPFSMHDMANVAHQMPQSAPLELWHRRLGHLNVRSVKALQSIVNGMHIKDGASNSAVCEGCIEGKLSRTPFPSEGGQRASKPLELVHSDVCGPFKTTSMGGCLYFVTFIDDYSRKVWVYVLKSKGEVFAKFVEFKALVEKQSEHKIKAFRSDNGGEFTSKAFERFLQAHGIERQLSTPYTPQQNGVAERANRTIVEMARSMLHHQNLNKNLWAEAVVTAVYTRNRCPTNALVGKTPEEAWSGKRPTITHMRVFGCIAYAKVPDEKRTKLDAKGTKCLFLGYCEGTKAYRLMCLETKKILKCRDVVFAEEATCGDANVEMHPSGSLEPPSVIVVDAPPISAPIAQGVAQESQGVQEPQHTQEEEVVVESHEEIGEGQRAQGSRYPTRERRPLGEWWLNHILPPPSEVERANVACFDDPLTLRDALQSVDASKWESAMQEEYASLMANGTWELAPLPKDRKSVGCKWVFRTKMDAQGNVVRYKARLVARGFSQVEGVDFHDTFAPVAKFTTIRCMLAIGAAMDLEIHQMDVKTAFLNGELEEDIYMDQPLGFVEEGTQHLVCKLKKSLYGLKQSPRAWYQRIDTFFTKEGFSRSHADHSLYVKQSSEFLLIVIIYVDDLIILASGDAVLGWLKAKLEKEFEMSDLGPLEFCLGVAFERNRSARTITMSQSKYIEEVLKRFNMEDCKPIGTPLDVKGSLLKLSDEEFKEVEEEMKAIPYKAAVGSLMYAMVATRADLAFPVSMVSQFMAKAGPQHWMAVKRILRYLKGTIDYKLCLGGKNIELKGYCDADWAGDVNERRSTTGYVFFVGDGAISWNCKRQPTIAVSTTEAEYMATSHCLKEALWLRQLLEDVGLVQRGATSIMCDNQGCIALAKDPKHHSRTKHIDVQHHFIREKLEDGEVSLWYCPTEDMVADVLTKALAKVRHEKLTKAMGLRGGNYSQSGSVED
jgi:transposase InsO family protein